MDAAVEHGRNPVSKHQIQPEYGDEQADAGRDCRSTGDIEIFIFLVQLTTSRIIGNLTRLIFTRCVTIHEITNCSIGYETKFSGANGDREISIFPVQLTTSRISNITRLIDTLLYVMTIRTTYNHFCAWNRGKSGYSSSISGITS